jgi:hypothetical protein
VRNLPTSILLRRAGHCLDEAFLGMPARRAFADCAVGQTALAGLSGEKNRMARPLCYLSPRKRQDPPKRKNMASNNSGSPELVSVGRCQGPERSSAAFAGISNGAPRIRVHSTWAKDGGVHPLKRRSSASPIAFSCRAQEK